MWKDVCLSDEGPTGLGFESHNGLEFPLCNSRFFFFFFAFLAD